MGKSFGWEIGNGASKEGVQSLSLKTIANSIRYPFISQKAPDSSLKKYRSFSNDSIGALYENI